MRMIHTGWVTCLLLACAGAAAEDSLQPLERAPGEAAERPVHLLAR